MLFCLALCFQAILWKACLFLQVSTVVLRASTDNTLDDLERAVDDGVNAYRVCCAWICGDRPQAAKQHDPHQMLLECLYLCMLQQPSPISRSSCLHSIVQVAVRVQTMRCLAGHVVYSCMHNKFVTLLLTVDLHAVRLYVCLCSYSTRCNPLVGLTGKVDAGALQRRKDVAGGWGS